MKTHQGTKSKAGMVGLPEVEPQGPHQWIEEPEVSGAEREQIERALLESEERFRSVVMLAADAIVLADNKGIIISWNGGAERVFGYKAEEVLGKPVAILMPKRYRQSHSKGLERLGSNSGSRIVGKTIELHGLNKDGVEFPMELSLATWKRESKTFFSAIVRDITKRKRTDEEIRSLKELNESVVESIQDGLVVVDQDFLITLWNKSMEEISGSSSEEVLGKSALDEFLNLEELELGKMFKAAFGGESSMRSNVYYETPQGEVGYVNLKSFPMPDSDGKVRQVLIVVENLSNILRLEQEVASLKDEAKQHKLVEVAKGILMREWGVSVLESHKFIVKESQDNRIKTVELAKRVINLLGNPDEKKKLLY